MKSDDMKINRYLPSFLVKMSSFNFHELDLLFLEAEKTYEIVASMLKLHLN